MYGNVKKINIFVYILISGNGLWGVYNLLNFVFNIWVIFRVWIGRNFLKNKGIRIMCFKCLSVM